jgi:hypothetical protein
MASRKTVLIPDARKALNKLKMEIASEIGISDYDKIDKGNLPSRQNGYVGGNMVKTLILMAERGMIR